MENDSRSYGRAGKLFRVTTAVDRQTSINTLLSFAAAWHNSPESSRFSTPGDDYEFSEDVDDAATYYCDTPYGWCLGGLVYADDGDLCFESLDSALPDLNATVVWDAGCWKTDDYEMAMGGPFPPLVVPSRLATAGPPLSESAPAQAARPALKTLPDGTVPVQFPSTPNNSAAALPTPEVASGIKAVAAEATADSNAAKLPAKKASKPVIDQALDEGYVPISSVSPTGLVRPILQSPTQLLAYLVACTAFDVDLAVNEMQDFMDNKELFYARLWPEWANPVHNRPVVKRAAPPVPAQV